MLLGCLVELVGAVLQRTLCQQIDHASATVEYPLDRLAAVYETENLDAFQAANLAGIAANHPDGLLLALRHSGRSHLDAVYIDIVEQLAGYHQLLVRQEAHAIGLFAIAQGRVHNLYEGHCPLPLAVGLFCAHILLSFIFLPLYKAFAFFHPQFAAGIAWHAPVAPGRKTDAAHFGSVGQAGALELLGEESTAEGG